MKHHRSVRHLLVMLLLAALGACAGPAGDAGDAGDADDDSAAPAATAEPAGAPASGADTEAGEPPEAASAGEWEVLFDGSNLDRWRGYREDQPPGGWVIEDSSLAFVPGGEGGDLVTREQYGDFELVLDWRISQGGNSGIFYRATEEGDYAFETGAEMQVLDNDGHADGESPLTSAGSNFGLYPATEDVTRPVGEWNRARIVARGPHIQHWLNGTMVVEYRQGSDEWRERVAETKFADWPEYGEAMRGHIGLQDHGNRVWYRDIRIRRLEASDQPG